MRSRWESLRKKCKRQESIQHVECWPSPEFQRTVVEHLPRELFNNT